MIDLTTLGRVNIRSTSFTAMFTTFTDLVNMFTDMPPTFTEPTPMFTPTAVSQVAAGPRPATMLRRPGERSERGERRAPTCDMRAGGAR